MKDINTIVLSGTVASDGELKHVGANGTALLTFQLYVEREYVYKDKHNIDKSYFTVKVWGLTAEEVGAQLRQDDHVTIQGRLTQESWEGADRKRIYKVLVVADSVVNNDRRTKPVAVGSCDPIRQESFTPAPMPSKPTPPAFDSSPLDVKATILDADNIDDIPF